MKVRVINEFIDRYTGELHKKGTEIDCTQERYEEILSKGPLVKKIYQRGKKNEKI